MTDSVQKKKSFALGWSMIPNAMIGWICFNFYNTVSLNIFMPAIAELWGLESTAPLLYWNTVGALISCLVTVFGGKLIEKFGAKWVMCISAIIEGIIFFLIPMVGTLGLCKLLIACNAMTSVLYCQLTTVVIIGNWFPRKKGTILGLVTSAIILTSLVMLPLFNRATTAWGITKAMQVFALFIIAWGVVSIFWVKNSPSMVGLNPDNEPMTPEEEARLTTANNSESSWTILDFFKCPRLIVGAVGWGIVTASLMGVSTIIIPMMTSNGLSQTLAVTIASFSGLAGFIGSNVSGIVDGKSGTIKAAIFVVIILVVGDVLLGLSGTTILMVIGYYCVMLAFGAPNNLYSSQCLGLVGPQNYAAVFKIFLAVAVIIRATGTSISGFSLAHFGSYRPAFLFFAVVNVISIFLIIFSGEKYIPSPEEKKAQSAA